MTFVDAMKSRLGPVARAERGAAQAVDCADRASPDWSTHALTIVKAYCRMHAGKRFLAQDIITYAHETCGMPLPPDIRAWGSVIKTAARDGRLKAVGFTTVGTNNASPKILWEAKP